MIQHDLLCPSQSLWGCLRLNSLKLHSPEGLTPESRQQLTFFAASPAWRSKTPGRTQLLNFFELSLKGEIPRQKIPECFLVDLPGYGYAKAAPETRRNWEGLVGGYVQQRPQLMGMVLVMDARRPFMPADEFLLDFLSVRPDLKLHLLLNKADQLKTMEKRQVLNTVKDRALAMGNHVSVQLFSGLKKEGVEQLQNVLCTWLNLPLGS